MSKRFAPSRGRRRKARRKEPVDDRGALRALAGRKAEATALAERSVRFYAMKARTQPQSLLSAYIEAGDKAKVLEALAYVQGTNVPMIGQLGEAVIYALTPKFGKKGSAFVLLAYDTLLRRFDLKRPMADDQLAWTRTATPCSARRAVRPRRWPTSSGSTRLSPATSAPRAR